MYFETEKNRIEQVRATIQNTSSAQASYLTGMSKKYTAKAVLRAGTVNITTTEILTNLRQYVLPKLLQNNDGDDNMKYENAEMSIL